MDFKKFLAISALFTLLLSACVTEDKTPDDSDSDSGSEVEEDSTSVMLKLAMVAMEDNGESGEAIGCGDSIVFVDKEVTGDLDEDEEKIERALDELFAVGTPFYGQSGLYNGLTHSSNLAVNEVELENGSLRVDISGNLISAGTCDDPRIKEQIVSTIEENSDFAVTDEDVFINGESLKDYFDMSN